LRGAAGKECVAGDDEGIGALRRKGGKSRVDLAAGAGVEGMNLQPDGPASFLRVPQRGLGDRRIGRIDKHGNTNGLGH
jgi:hypothetical protein